MANGRKFKEQETGVSTILPNRLCSSEKIIRVLAFIEASWITGPAKNLIEFARRAGQSRGDGPRVDIAIATFHRRKDPDSNEFIKACQDAGVELHLIQEGFAFDPRVIRSMARLVGDYKPDIIQTHAVKSHFLVRFSRLNRAYRWIAFHHGYTRTDSKARLYNQLDRWSLQSATRVVTVCRPFASALAKMGVAEERISIRHNAVKEFWPAAVDEVLELRRNLKIPENAKVLVTVGRLSREKGQADLITALGILRKRHPERQLRLLLVGEGPDGPQLKKVASRCGVEDWVVLAGHQANVAIYYTLTDLMVLPSHTEGSPNALLEAMAARVPIVATAVGGIPEIVRPYQEAVLVEKEQPVALAAAIQRVLTDLELQRNLVKSAYDVAGQYSPAAYCASMLGLYQSCMTADSPGTKRNRLLPLLGL